MQRTDLKTGTRRLASIAALALFSLSGYSRQAPLPGATLTGKVTDAKTKQPFEFVAVSVLRARDSVVVTGSLTGKEGNFSIKNIPVGDYLVKAAFVGYKSFWKALQVKTTGAISFGTIALEEGITLGEVALKGEVTAVKITDDTTAYNAAAFKARPDANVEDALRKLPGVEVDRNGTIKSEGEEVKKVTVDGKDFFGNDPKIATKNLPADAVKEYQVINDKTEKAKATGIDDGTREKRLNIVLKDDKKGGWFGSGSMAGGTRERYLGSLSLNHFIKDKQFSIVGGSNNVNQSTYSNEDIIYSLGSNQGQTKSNSAGLNFSDSWGKKNNIAFTGSYFGSSTGSTVESESASQNALPNGDFLDKNLNFTQRTSRRHNINSRFNVTIDSLTSFYIYPSVSLTSSDGGTNSTFSKSTAALQSINAGSRSTDQHSSSPSVSGQASFTHRFHQRRGSVGMYISYSANSNGSDNYTVSKNRFFQSAQPDIDINRLENQDNSYYSFSVNPSVSRIYGGRVNTLSFSPFLNFSRTSGDRNTLEYDPASGLYINLLDSLTNNTVTDNRQAGFSGSYNRSGKKVGLYFTSSLANLAIDGSIRNNKYDEGAELNYWLFNQSGQVILRLKPSRNLTFNASSNANTPSIGDVLIRQNNTDPLYITEGNPGLKPSRAYNGSVRYTSSNLKRNSSTSLTANYTTTFNALSRSSFQDNNTGITTTKRVNLDGNYRLSASGSFTVPTAIKGLRLSPGVSIVNSRNVSLNNGLKNNSDVVNSGGNLTLSYAYKESLHVTLSSRSGYSTVKNSVTKTLNPGYLTMDNYGDISVEPFKKWRLTTNFSHRVQAGNSYMLINTGLQRYFMDKNRLLLEIKAFDLLNRNADIIRTVSETSITDARSNNMNRYFYMKLTYKVNKLGGGAPPPPGRPVILDQVRYVN